MSLAAPSGVSVVDLLQNPVYYRNFPEQYSSPRKKNPNKPQTDTEEAIGVGKATSIYYFLEITWVKVPGFGLGGLDTDQDRSSSQTLL